MQHKTGNRIIQIALFILGTLIVGANAETVYQCNNPTSAAFTFAAIGAATASFIGAFKNDKK